MSDYADIRNEMAYRDANEDGMYDLCEDLVSMLVLRDAEIERLRGLMKNLVYSAEARPYYASEYGEVIVCGDDFNAIKKEVNNE